MTGSASASVVDPNAAPSEPKLFAVDLVKKVGLSELVKEDLANHHGDWTAPGFRAVAVYRFGCWAWTVRFWPVRKASNFLYRLLFRAVRNRYGIELERTAQIGRRFRIAHQGGIVIHSFAVIGDDCMVRQGVTLGAAGSEVSPKTAPTLGDRVDIAAGAIVIGRVKIGNDVRIGPNVVVQTNIPNGSTVFAQPPRVISGVNRAT